MTRLLPLLLLLLGATATLSAQRNCGSMDVLEQQIQLDPARQDQLNKIERFTERYLQEKAFSGGIVTIPVVVHVVYTNAAENISDAQIFSQMDVLNEDFRRQNADASSTPSVFAGVAADTEIEFCLTEIIRVSSRKKRGFGTNDSVKGSRNGSVVVTPESAMNMWVCNIGGGILGYAQFPGGSPSTDGVVVDYRYFGTVGAATAPFDLGRTATHEVGHYLNLRHIWGDTGCGGDDFVADTPLAGGPNYTGGACTFPGPNSCNSGSGDLPDMFQNYMDYSDDGCMNLFTTGQKDRMIAAINAARPGLLTGACDGTPPPPPANEICDNGIDDDGDGQIDCADGDCATASNCDNPPPPTGCAAPTGLGQSRAGNGRSATLSWNAVNGADDYFVEVYQGGSLFASGSVAGTSASISGLNKRRTYTWRVRSVCAGTTSDWADGSSFRQLFTATEAELTAFPNPTNAREVTVNWDLADAAEAPAGIRELRPSDRAVTVRLSDITGRTVRELSLRGNSGTTVLEVADLRPGVFVIRVIAADGYTVSTKLVKL